MLLLIRHPRTRREVTAQYAINYTLTVNNGAGGGQYPESQTVAIQANTPAEGKVFDKWTGDVTHVADVNSASTAVTMPPENVEVTATYKELADVEAIPTLSQWGVMILTALLLIFGAAVLRRRGIGSGLAT